MNDHNKNTPNGPSLFTGGVDHNGTAPGYNALDDREEIIVSPSEFDRHTPQERSDSRLGLIVKLLLLFAFAAIIGFFLSGKLKDNGKQEELLGSPSASQDQPLSNSEMDQLLNDSVSEAQLDGIQPVDPQVDSGLAHANASVDLTPSVTGASSSDSPEQERSIKEFLAEDGASVKNNQSLLERSARSAQTIKQPIKQPSDRLNADEPVKDQGLPNRQSAEPTSQARARAMAQAKDRARAKAREAAVARARARARAQQKTTVAKKKPVVKRTTSTPKRVTKPKVVVKSVSKPTPKPVSKAKTTVKSKPITKPTTKPTTKPIAKAELVAEKDKVVIDETPKPLKLDLDKSEAKKQPVKAIAPVASAVSVSKKDDRIKEQAVDEKVIAEADISAEEIAEEEIEETVEVTLYASASINEFPETSYAVQLIGMHDEKGFDRFIKAVPSEYEVHTYQRVRDSKVWSIAVLGPYENRDAAQKALNSLPDSLKSQSPWLKSAAKIKQEMAE